MTQIQSMTDQGPQVLKAYSNARKLFRIAGLVATNESPEGDDLGEATYAMMIKPGEEIHLNGGQRFRVLDVVPFDEEESPFVGLLQVEAT